MRKALLFFIVGFHLSASVPVYHQLEPQLVNQFPVNLQSGSVEISEAHTLSVGPEEVSIRRRYKSPKWDEKAHWWVNQYIHVYQTMEGYTPLYLVYDIEGENLLTLQPNKPALIYYDHKSLEPYTVTMKLENGLLIVDYGKGIQRIFEKNPLKTSFTYRLTREKTFLGNWRIYHYDRASRLVGIEVRSSDMQIKFGDVDFRYIGKEVADPSLMVSLNGQPKHIYKFTKPKEIYLLDYIEDMNRLREYYTYGEVSGKKKKIKGPLRLTKISYPTGGYLEFHYKKNQKNEHQVDQIFRQGAGWDERIKLADLHYGENECEVIFFDHQRHLYRYGDEGHLVFAKWGDIEQTHLYNQQGLLDSRVTKDDDGRILERKLTYDEKKNVTQDQLAFDGETFFQTYEYDDQGRLIHSSNSSGRIEHISYWGDTNLVERDEIGDHVNSFEYDTGGRVTKKREDDGKIISKIFEYERKGNDIIEEREGFINPKTKHLEINATHRYTYDAKHQIVRKESFDRVDRSFFWETFSYTPRGLIEEKRSSTGYWVRFLYDERGRILGEQGLDLEISYEYDSLGRVIKRIRQTSKRAPLFSEYFYDPYDRLIGKREESGKFIHYEYDLLHRKVGDETGHWELDVLGNRRVFRDVIGDLTTYETTLYAYPRKTVYPDGSLESCQFEEFGRIRTLIDGCGIQTKCKFDERSRLIEKNCEGRQIGYQYVGDKLVSVKEREKEVLKFSYDGFGRILTEEGLGSYKHYHYDHIGQLLSQEEEGKTTLFKRDGLGRVKMKWQGRSLSSYEYDERGEVLAWSRGEGDEKLTWRRVYDGFGDCCLEYEPRGGVTERIHGYNHEKIIDPMGRQEEIHTDEEGRVIYKNFERGLKEESFTYDGLGRLISHKLIQEGETKEASYNYDQRGRLVKLQDPYGIREKGYNERGELIWEKRENGIKISFCYNPHGELIEVKSDDRTVHYAYQYDEWGNVVETRNLITGKVGRRKYDEYHRMILEELENGLSIEYEYEGTRKRAIKLCDGSSIHYCYDQGEIARIYRLDRENNFLYDHLISLNTQGNIAFEVMIGGLGRIERGYTQALKMTSITTPFHFEKVLKRDLVGNILQVNRNGGPFIYPVDTFDRLENSKESCERDDAGRIIRFGNKSFSYDALDRLVEVNEGSDCVKLTYDAESRLISREVNGKLDRFIYDEMLEIGLVDESEMIRELRLLGYGKKGDIGRCVAIELDQVVYAPLNDLFGNIIGLVEMASKQLAGKWSLTPFGKEENSQGVVSPWRFQSKRIDETTGLVFFGFRIYLPQVQEYCQLDARGEVGIQDLLSFNQNNPLRYCDPWGLEVAGEGGYIPPNYDNCYSSPRDPAFKIIFENYPWTERVFIPNPDDIYHYPGREHSNKENAVVVMNGIRNDKSDCKKLIHMIAEHYSGKLVSVLNQSGGTAYDIARSFFELIGCETAPILNLRKILYDLHQEGYKNIHLLTHSEGGIIAKRAMEALPWALRENLSVSTFASPVRIPKCYAKHVENYALNNDVIARLSRFTMAADHRQGHTISYKILKSTQSSLMEHTIYSPSYVMTIAQILESIETNQ